MIWRSSAWKKWGNHGQINQAKLQLGAGRRRLRDNRGVLPDASPKEYPCSQGHYQTNITCTCIDESRLCMHIPAVANDGSIAWRKCIVDDNRAVDHLKVWRRLCPIRQCGAQSSDLSISTNPKQEEWEPSWKGANFLAYLFDRPKT